MGINIGEIFPDIDWYYDRCNSYLNSQSDFDGNKYIWECTEYGYKNSISRTNIYDSEDDSKNR